VRDRGVRLLCDGADDFAALEHRTGGQAAPNVVVLLSDDLGYRDIGCYGGPVRTPSLDGLGFGETTTSGGDAAEEMFDLGSFASDDLDLSTGNDSGGVDIDELTTKLDLARAYVDMEDRESALDILDEVLEDAPASIRAEAEALKKQLG